MERVKQKVWYKIFQSEGIVFLRKCSCKNSWDIYGNVWKNSYSIYVKATQLKREDFDKFILHSSVLTWVSETEMFTRTIRKLQINNVYWPEYMNIRMIYKNNAFSVHTCGNRRILTLENARNNICTEVDKSISTLDEKLLVLWIA